MNGKAGTMRAAALLLGASAAFGDLGTEVPDGVERTGEKPAFSVEENVLRIVARAEDPSHPPGFWATRLARLGPEAAPAIIELLVDVDMRARQQAEDDAEREEENPLAERDDGEQERTSPLARERRVARGALELMGRDAVVPALEQRARGGVAMPAVRGTLLDAVAAVGGVEELDLAIGLVWPAGGGAQDVAPLLPFLDQAVAELVRRDPRTYLALADRILDARHDIAVGLIRATSGTRTRGGLDALSGLLGRSARLDPVLLANIGEMGASHRVRPGAGLREQVRAYLGTHDENVLRAAVLTLGDLRDEASVESLIDLLGSENDALVRASMKSLRKTTGMGYPADRLRWTTWYLSESQWYRSRGAELFAQLDEEDPASVAQALEELGATRIHRARTAERVAALLDHAEPGIRREACHALRRLGAPQVLPALVERLADSDAEVVEAAGRALQRVTGFELELDVDVWREALATAD